MIIFMIMKLIFVYYIADRPIQSKITMRTNNKLSRRTAVIQQNTKQIPYTIKQNNRLSADIISS